jgi:hypothetical protein
VSLIERRAQRNAASAALSALLYVSAPRALGIRWGAPAGQLGTLDDELAASSVNRRGDCAGSGTVSRANFDPETGPGPRRVADNT